MRAVRAEKAGKAVRAVRAEKAGKAGRAVRIRKAEGAGRAVRIRKAEGAGRDRLWVEYFSGFGRVIRCLYFGDCSLILRSS